MTLKTNNHIFGCANKIIVRKKIYSFRMVNEWIKTNRAKIY